MVWEQSTESHGATIHAAAAAGAGTVRREAGWRRFTRPDIRVTARHRCRAVRQAMRTRLVQRLLRRLGLPVGLILGTFF